MLRGVGHAEPVTPRAGLAPVPAAADVVLLGGGGAAVIVLQHLAAVLHERAATGDAGERSGRGEGVRAATPGPLRVVVVDPVDRLRTRPADRTWCSWWDADDPHLALLRPSVAASWRRLAVVDREGVPRVLDLGALRYVMVRGEDLYAAVAEQVAALDGALQVTHVSAAVTSVVAGPHDVVVETPDGSIAAPVALDSRPAAPVRAAATRLLQHFRGEVVADASGGRGVAVLMDFSLPQPAVGVAFGYRLPAPDGTTLVEYTEFSPAVLDDAGYAAALGGYRQAVGLADAPTEHVEQGVIPMDDAVRRAVAGPRVVRIGGAGGAIRGSTGYAFAAMQRQGSAIAAAIVREHAAGRDLSADAIAPPRPYPRRHAWMDAVVLRALADGSLRGADFFPRLFARNPPERVLRFLDGSTTPREELALMATAPLGVMVVSAVRDALWRLTRGRAAPRGTGSRRTRRRR